MPRASSDFTLLFNPPQISVCQAIILNGMLTCSLQAVLCNGPTDLLALTRVWPLLGLTLYCQQGDHG